jgi:hypothetical protein
VAAVSCVQDMLLQMRILETLGLKVKKPMILEIDNKGAKDLANNWSVGGCTRHMDVRDYFLRDLKEDGVITVQWIPTNDNGNDLFTSSSKKHLVYKTSDIINVMQVNAMMND